jgi:uncharacterized protein (TIGR00661 family)
LISGSEYEIHFPFELNYRFHGLGFVFGKRGGVDLYKTWAMADTNLFFSECRNLPVRDYDLVISDFEPVSSWACRLAKIPCISLSHQAGVMDPAAPAVRRFDPVGRFVLKHYAPSSLSFGFHFKQWSHRMFPPVVGNEVRQLQPKSGNHITVYLPAYEDQYLSELFKRVPEVEWHIFSKRAYDETSDGNIHIRPVSRKAYLRSLEASLGLLCGAGFEAPAEAMLLGKKLMVSPMKNQLEQHLNAAAAVEMGASVIPEINQATLPTIKGWIKTGSQVSCVFPDRTEDLVNKVISAGLEHKKVFKPSDYPSNPLLPVIKLASGRMAFEPPVTEFEWSQRRGRKYLHP